MSGLVLKVGGRVSTGSGALADLPAVLAGSAGTSASRVCIVHGGGAEISRWMERLALPVRFKDGLRVTDEAALELAIMILRGSVSATLVRDLAAIGVAAVGISGLDGGTALADPHPDAELGAVGEVRQVQPALLLALQEAGMVPLLAPLALDGAGNIRNVNADTLAGAVAGALDADLAIFLTDVPGVLGEDGRLIDRLDTRAVQRLIENGVIRGGMLPKVRAALAALERGARAVCIADGREQGVLPAILSGTSGMATIIEGVA